MHETFFEVHSSCLIAGSLTFWATGFPHLCDVRQPWWRNGSTHNSTGPDCHGEPGTVVLRYGYSKHVPHVVAQKKRKEKHSKPFARFRVCRRRGERGAIVAKLALCKDARRHLDSRAHGLDVIHPLGFSRSLHTRRAPANGNFEATRGAQGATPHTRSPCGEGQPSRGDVPNRKTILSRGLENLDCTHCTGNSVRITSANGGACERLLHPSSRVPNGHAASIERPARIDPVPFPHGEPRVCLACVYMFALLMPPFPSLHLNSTFPGPGEFAALTAPST